jgi:hypothetical protein
MIRQTLAIVVTFVDFVPSLFHSDEFSAYENLESLIVCTIYHINCI